VSAIGQWTTNIPDVVDKVQELRTAYRCINFLEQMYVENFNVIFQGK